MTTLLTATYPHQGRNLTLMQLHRLFRLPLATLHRRLVEEGMTVEEALTTPFERQSFTKPSPSSPLRYFFRGKRLTVIGHARETGIPLKTIHARLEEGWPLDKALSTPVEPQPTKKAGAKKRLIPYAGA